NMANPGETVDLIIDLENSQNWAEAVSITVSISFENSDIQIINNNIDFGALQPGATTSNISQPFSVSIPANGPLNDYAFTITVEALGTSGGLFSKEFEFEMPVNLMLTNWPWFSDVNFGAAPILEDVNGDGIDDLILLSKNSVLHVLDYTSTELPGYPVDGDDQVDDSPAMADIDDDGSNDIIWATRTGKVFAKDLQGNEIWTKSGFGDISTSPVILNADGNGSWEIAFAFIETGIYLLDSSGNVMTGFPVNNESRVTSDLATADINGDGTDEIIAATIDGLLHVYTVSGTELSGFPADLGVQTSCSPIVLGNKHIAIGTNFNRLKIFNPDGTCTLDLPISGRIAGSPVAANVDWDGAQELIFRTLYGELYVINQDGTDKAGFPLSSGANTARSPLVGDIDNDGVLDIVQFGNNCYISIYNTNGVENSYSPIPSSGIGCTPPALGDIDNDGDVDLIGGWFNGFMVIDIKTPMGIHHPWPVYRGNNRRTAYYGDANVLPVDNGLVSPAITEFTSIYPNPFNPETSICFSLDNQQNVTLDVYNIRGRKVKTLISAKLEAGEHQIIWNGENTIGQKAASGLYLFALKTSAKTLVRKAVMLK
ncbi:MAG: T9SS type A sorting domain-containing protein, partial [Candidatus Cloacimonetes bacterium]|nr:T9SS type A sorting domain-containing protein [Candidatus Cloacimonadota bacterium]